MNEALVSVHWQKTDNTGALCQSNINCNVPQYSSHSFHSTSHIDANPTVTTTRSTGRTFFQDLLLDTAHLLGDTSNAALLPLVRQSKMRFLVRRSTFASNNSSVQLLVYYRHYGAL
jgi:hypothetical protein